jgi:UDP-glucose:glycoprotein glucosyltransferase
VHPCSTLGSEEQLVLPGYGVEAVLKNMEYSAMDDKAKADAAAAAKKAAKAKVGAGSSDDISEIDVASLGEVKGFKFDVLAQRKPHLVQELLTFRDVLVSNDEDEAIKVCLVPEAHVTLHLASHHCASLLWSCVVSSRCTSQED